MRHAWNALTIVATLAAAAPWERAAAQQSVDPKACSEQQRLRLDNGGAPRDPSNQSLSEKLDKTEGVICPPDVDPAIKAPTPSTGQMPVVPPPGSPGGDPNVRPK